VCAVSAAFSGWNVPKPFIALLRPSSSKAKAKVLALQPKEGQAMPQIVETTVFRLDELSEGAREQARAWYRDAAACDDWHECVFDDFKVICTILGIRLKTRTVRLFGGGTRQKPCIWFTGFASQGDGACFECSYAYAKNAPKVIRTHAPEDSELHRLADALQAIQRRNFYQLRAGVSQRGRYSHEYSMSIVVERDSSNNQEMTADAEDAVAELMRDLARWLYRQLEREHEYRTSDDVTDDAIIANEFTFTSDGRRFG
jgi:hypothetical protein